MAKLISPLNQAALRAEDFAWAGARGEGKATGLRQRQLGHQLKKSLLGKIRWQLSAWRFFS